MGIVTTGFKPASVWEMPKSERDRGCFLFSLSLAFRWEQEVGWGKGRYRNRKKSPANERLTRNLTFDGIGSGGGLSRIDTETGDFVVHDSNSGINPDVVFRTPCQEFLESCHDALCPRMTGC